MTDQQLAQQILDKLRRMKPHSVYAGRKGICAFSNEGSALVIGFRQRAGCLFLEKRQFSNHAEIPFVKQVLLEGHLAEQVSDFLDTL